MVHGVGLSALLLALCYSSELRTHHPVNQSPSLRVILNALPYITSSARTVSLSSSLPYSSVLRFMASMLRDQR